MEAHYVKSLLAVLSLIALPVMAAEPTLYGRYEYIALPEIGGEVPVSYTHLTLPTILLV